MPIKALGYIGINTADVAAWRELATNVLGAQPVKFGDNDSLFLKVDERVYRMAVHPSEENGVAYIGWEVRDRLALERVASELKGAGVVVREGTSGEAAARGVGGLLHCEDPSGFPLEIFFGQKIEPRALVSPTGARFVTGDCGMGHITFMVRNYQQTLDFYTHLLGFRISDFMDGHLRAAWLRCNPRHHSLALIDGGDRRQVHHIMLQVEELDMVGRSLDKCLSGAAPITLTLGRHWNDHMVSFYMQTPSGFYFEYGWGGRRIEDPDEPAVQGTGEIAIWGHRALTPEFAALTGQQAQGSPKG